MPGARVGRAIEVVGGLADGARLALGAAAFFGITASETEGRGRDVAADLADVVESGETTDARCGAAGLVAADAEDNLPDVEVANVDDRAVPGGFAGANDDLRVGAEGPVDGLGGMAALEDGVEVDSGDFFAAGLDEGAVFELEEGWTMVEGLPEMVGVSVALEIGGGTAFVTPAPNLPEFRICNAEGACQKETAKAASTSYIKEMRKYLLHLRGRGTTSAFSCSRLNCRSGSLRQRRRRLLFRRSGRLNHRRFVQNR